MALIQRRISVAKFLLANGAFPHLEDSTGRDSCDYAVINEIKIPELIECLQPRSRKKWFSKQEQADRGLLSTTEEGILRQSPLIRNKVVKLVEI